MLRQLQVKFQHKSREGSDIVNGDSGIVNTHSGEWQKVFTFEQNQCSRSFRITVHVRPERVFTLPQNMHNWTETTPIERLMTHIEGLDMAEQFSLTPAILGDLGVLCG